MKKFIYIILTAVSSAMILSSCTEEKVEPNVNHTTNVTPPVGSDPS